MCCTLCVFFKFSLYQFALTGPGPGFRWTTRSKSHSNTVLLKAAQKSRTYQRPSVSLLQHGHMTEKNCSHYFKFLQGYAILSHAICSKFDYTHKSLKRNVWEFFQDISEPTSCLHHPLPEPREHAITSKLRTREKCPLVMITRTKCYCSFNSMH